MMQYKNIKLIAIFLSAFVLLSGLSFVAATPQTAMAAVEEGGGASTNNDDGSTNNNPGSDCVEIGVSVPGEEDKCVEKGTDDNNPIFLYLKGIIRFLAAGVGIAITISIVIGGIQYMMSRGNPQATQAAIGRITNAVIALVLFILMAAILNFLVPGGLL